MPVASAQTGTSLRVDPNTAGEGTTALIALDGAGLSSAGSLPTSIVAALPRGTRLDTRAVARLCSRSQAVAARCPEASKVGFGRMVQSVSGFLPPGGTSELAWSIGVYLAVPERSADAAALVLRAELLAAASVDQLLAPRLGVSVPHVARVTGRLVRQAGGSFGPQVSIPALPGLLSVPGPAVVTPTRFQLAIGAGRRTREAFVRRVRVRTLSGYRIQNIPDHRLVGHDLLRNPGRCGSSWAAELRIGFPKVVRRTAFPIVCTSQSIPSS